MVPEGTNPCRFQVKYKQRPRERFLTGEEFRRLGRVLSRRGDLQGRLRARGGGDPSADADWVPAQRDIDAALGRGGPGGERVAV